MKKTLLIILSFIFIASCKNKKTAKQEDIFYTCSMDPQVISDKPGKCPICGMQLTPVKKNSVKNTDDIELSDQQIQLGNIHVDTIRKAGMANTIELSGTLNSNASQSSSVSARVMGRIEKLYIKTTGDYISKGAPLYELYSEELNSAKQEYIAALQRKDLFKEQTLIDFDKLIESARTKLRLWGMTEKQVVALEKQKQASLTTTFYSTESGYITSLEVTEGGYVMEGGTIVQLTDLSTLWAEAQIYTSQLYKVPKGAVATVYIPGINEEIKGRIEFANPEVASDTRINLLRVVIPNRNNQLKPGMSVLVRVETTNINSLALPTDAIIHEAKGATVWLQTGKNRFRNAMVITGLETNGLTEITSGLKEGDIIVVEGTYLLHSEFIFKRGADPMATHNH
jgi:Cu(I)/Ag(I) efflux system membrane fusion protein